MNKVAWRLKNLADLIDHILNVAVTSNHRLGAGGNVKPAFHYPPELAAIAHMPRSPDVCRPDDGPDQRQIGCASKLFADSFAFTVNCRRKVIRIIFRERSRSAN